MKTFKQLAPKWNRALEILKKDGYAMYTRFTWGNDLDMSQYDKCVVAESWGWYRKEYRFMCPTCMNLADDFSEALPDAIDGRGRRMSSVKSRFVKHRNRMH